MASVAPNPRIPGSGTEPVSSTYRMMESCAAHDHICLIYDTREEQLAAVVPFLRIGLERGEKCLYIVDENTPEIITAALKEDGVDTDAAFASGALAILDQSQAYLKNGDFDPDRMIAYLKEALDAAEAEGFTAFRVTGETTWALRPPKRIDPLIEYECRLNDFFPRQNLLAICQYNRRRFRPETLLHVIHTHPFVVCGDLVCENPHYMPPEVFDPKQFDPAAEVQRLLNGIAENAQLKRELAAEAEQAHLLSAETTRWRQLYEAVLANTPDLGCIFDLNRRFTYANGALLELLGRKWEDVIGKTGFEIGFEPSHAALHDREIERVVATRKSIRGEFLFNGAGGFRTYDYIFYPVIGPTGEVEAVGAATRDITDRKKAERLLDEQKNLLELIASGSSLEECLTALTASVKRLRPKASAAVLVADEARAKIDRALSSEFPVSLSEGIQGAEICELAMGTCGKAIFEGKPVTCADIANDETWAKPWRDLCIAHGALAARSTPVFDSTGKAIASFFMCFAEPHEPNEWECGLGQFGAHIAGIAIERDRAIQSRRESERLLETELGDMRRLQSISSEISYEENLESLYGKILDAAVAIMHSEFGSMQMIYPERGAGGELRLLACRGFSPEAERFWEWVRPDSGSSCGEAMRSGKRVVVSDTDQCEWMAGTADLFSYHQTGIRAVQTTPLVSRGGKLLGMISTHWREPHEPSERDLRGMDILARQAADLLDRKLAAERQRQSEAALRKSEKFAAAGRMAATIAHEINNPLEAIMNLCYLLGQEELSPAGRELLDALDSELNRVSHIAKQTLEFYRNGKSAGPMDIAQPIDAAVGLFSRKAQAGGVEIEARYRAFSKVFGFPGELRQVFANLIDNALEAGSTKVRIRVSPARDHARGNRAGVSVLVADDGLGIPADSVGRLFEPFFTTKEEKGTGLGLWVSKGIVQKHEGWIRMHTSTRAGRRGTTFCMFLPVLQETPSGQSGRSYLQEPFS